MKVLYFSRDFTTHDHRFLAAIVEAGHEAFFLRLERRGPRLDGRPLPKGAQEIAWVGGQRPFSWWAAPRLVSGLQGVIEDLQPDVIHAGPLPTVGVLAALSGFHPLTLMAWGSDILRDAQRSVVVRQLVRYALARADAFIADCEAVVEAAARLGFPRAGMASLPWGLDLKVFTPKGSDGGLRKRLGWKGKFVLMHTRNWETLYGVETVARGFAAAAKRNENLRLVMLGGGSLEGSIRRIFETAGVSDQVHFTGQVALAELPNYYHAADLYVSATLSDGTSVSLMEALASGVPALVSAVGGNLEWVRPGVEGWLFSVGDADALAERILGVAEMGNALDEISRAARRRAEEKADWEQNKLGIQRAYELAIARANG